MVYDMAKSSNPVLVDTKSAGYSKVVWTLIAGLAGSALTYWGVEDPEMRTAIMGALQAVTGSLAIVFKVWFTKTVAPQSVR